MSCFFGAGILVIEDLRNMYSKKSKRGNHKYKRSTRREIALVKDCNNSSMKKQEHLKLTGLYKEG